jgi:methyl-accepting chemotaxis protein
MEQVVQQAASNSEETSSAAEELSGQAQGLASMVAAFQLDRLSGGRQLSGGGRGGAPRLGSGGNPVHTKALPGKRGGASRPAAPMHLKPEDVIPLDQDADFKQF